MGGDGAASDLIHLLNQALGWLDRYDVKWDYEHNEVTGRLSIQGDLAKLNTVEWRALKYTVEKAVNVLEAMGFKVSYRVSRKGIRINWSLDPWPSLI